MCRFLECVVILKNVNDAKHVVLIRLRCRWNSSLPEGFKIEVSNLGFLIDLIFPLLLLFGWLGFSRGYGVLYNQANEQRIIHHIVLCQQVCIAIDLFQNLRAHMSVQWEGARLV